MSDIPAGDGKIGNIFYSVTMSYRLFSCKMEVKGRAPPPLYLFWWIPAVFASLLFYCWKPGILYWAVGFPRFTYFSSYTYNKIQCASTLYCFFVLIFHSILLGPPGCTQAFPNLRPGLLNCFGVAPKE